MAFTLSLFAAITVQKNTRDCAVSDRVATLQTTAHDYALGNLNT